MSLWNENVCIGGGYLVDRKGDPFIEQFARQADVTPEEIEEIRRQKEKRWNTIAAKNPLSEIPVGPFIDESIVEEIQRRKHKQRLRI